MPDISLKKDFINIVWENLKQTQIQIISEWYEILQKAYKLEAQEIAKVFDKINHNKFNSILIQKACNLVLTTSENRKYLIDETKDITTPWEFEIDLIKKSLEKNTLNTMMFEAFQAKNFSQKKEKRVVLHDKYFFNAPYNNINLKHFITLLESALNFALYISYIQYIDYLENFPKIKISEVLEFWSADNCDLWSNVLKNIKNSYNESELNWLLASPRIKDELIGSLQDFKTLNNLSVNFCIPTPCLTTSLNYFYELIDNNSWASLVELFNLN